MILQEKKQEPHQWLDCHLNKSQAWREMQLQCLEVLRMVNEDWTFDLVAVRTTVLHRLGHGRWSTREHTDLSHFAVQLLQPLKKAVELWPTEVSNGAEAAEQGTVGNLLEVTLADVLQ